jgi:AraC-like DNA-binding protein
MYFISMEVRSALGAWVTHCQVRKNYRTGYHHEKSLRSEQGCSLTFMTGGAARFHTGQHAFQAEKGEMVFWNPGGMREYGPLPGKGFSFYVLIFRPLGAGPAGLDLPSRFTIRETGKATGLFHALYRTFNGPDPSRLQKCSKLTLELLGLIEENRGQSSAAPETPGAAMDPRITATLAFINDHYKERIRISDLAKRVSMHHVHFTRLFQRCTGMAPRDYLLEKKIEKAKDFITILGDTPYSTSLEMGFHDYSHFYRTFKRLTGLSPSEYARRYLARTGGVRSRI